MKGKSVKRIILKRVLPTVLAASMITGIVEWKNLRLMRARASTSLPGIENIISSLIGPSGSYSILDVSDSSEDALFGYYVEGQEPVKFERTLKSKKSLNERTEWAQSYLKGLSDKGILSNNDSTPLTAVSEDLYTEYYPWVNIPTGDYTTLSLGHDETVSVNALPKEADGGSFNISSSSFEYREGGDYVQNISFINPIDFLGNCFDSDEALSSEKAQYIFYKPEFKQVSKDNVNEIDDKDDDSYFHFSAEENLPLYSFSDDGNKVFDQAASEDREFKSGTKYYAITAITAVKPGSELSGSLADLKAAGWYASPIDETKGFVKASAGQTGYFTFNLSSFQYVGKGNGSYDLTDASADPNGQYKVSYNEIRYKGGYINNNWFARRILDCSETSDIDAISSRITVNTVTPGSVPSVLSSYGLVVLDPGVDGKSLSLTDSDKDYITAFANGKGALLADSRALADNGILTSAGVSSSKVNGSFKDGYVDKSVFLFRNGTDKRKNTVTGDLSEKYPDSDYSAAGSGFYEVYDSIMDENFLRKQKNKETTDLLSEEVSMASCIRYIISYNASTVRNNKTSVRILDIEPDTDSPITKDGKLNDDLRTKWFGTTYKSDQISVTTMSTRTLVGKTEDISEKYDLVYVGAGTNLTPKYTDTAMDGLVYYNIGDYTYINQNGSNGHTQVTVGMNTVEYETPQKTMTYRKSGNDITPKKYKELLSFVKAGHPVIVSDDLVSNTQKLRVGISDIKLDTSKGRAKLVVTPQIKNFGENQVEYTYQWYRGWNNGGNFAPDHFSPISGQTSDSYYLSNDELNNSNYGYYYGYYCKITGVEIAGKSYTLETENQPVSQVIVPSVKSSYSATDTGSGSYYIKDGGSKDYTEQTFSYRSWDNKIEPPRYVNSYINWYDQTNYYYYWQDVNDPSIKTSGNMASLDDWEDGSIIQAFAVEKSTRKIRFASNKWRISIQMSGTASTYSLNNGKAAATVYVDNASTDAINSLHVDHYSRIFSLLSQAIGYDNVWKNSVVSPSTVVRYVNISSPEIKLIGAPAAYSGSTGKDSNLTDDTLTLSFKIVNTTDPSPSTTTYTGALYLDKDNNGLYTDDEVVSDMMIAGGDESDETNYADSMKGGISEDSAPSYSAAVILPDDMVGAVSWKLVVTQNPDSDNADTEYMPHASVNRISYKASKGNKPVINVLQVNSDVHSGSTRSVYNLEMANNGENVSATKIEKYSTWLRNETVTDKYKINIVTVTAYDFNEYRYPNGRKEVSLEKDGIPYKISSNQQIDLDAYDMIILGFSDSYCSLNRKSCYRIQEFADSGKSVLFTHDNSSHTYLTTNAAGQDPTRYFKSYVTWDNGVPDKNNRYAWASFDFNTTLRALDQMDVYGITDTRIGSGGVAEWNVSDKDDKRITDGFLASKNPNQPEGDDQSTSLSAEQINTLKSAGYSIAYKPESVTDDYDENKVVTVPQTQAFTDGFLHRYENGKNDNNSNNRFNDLTTTTVKQVNKGTITTYPYDINGKGLKVSTTHCQYSQLNLNSDNIVVWYTLDGSNWRYKEDPVNNYYLFSCGNIFYTGAGHDNNPTDDEAKLFINTMIAAYRQQATKPKAYFTGSAKSTKQVSSYLVQTGGKTMSAIDVLRNYIEDFTGYDTSSFTDKQLLDMKPCDSFGISLENLDIAAKAACTRMAYAMTENNNGIQYATIARNNADSLKYGPAVGDSGGENINIGNAHVKYLTENSTVGQICLGINRVLLNEDVDTNDVTIPGLTPDNSILKDQKYYFTIKDDNTGSSKVITPRFYLFSKKPIVGIDNKYNKDKYNKVIEEKGTDGTTGYYLDITKGVDVFDSLSSAQIEKYRSNRIYAMKFQEDNPALIELLHNGTVTIAIEPTVTVQKKTLSGQKTKVTINTAGLLKLG